MNTIKPGKKAEEFVATFYVNEGYSLLAMNYSSRFGEIDIILQKGTIVVFCEVKLRKQGSKVSSVEAVDYHKQKRISRTAGLFLEENTSFQNFFARFDVAAVTPDTQNGYELQIIENAFTIEDDWF